MSIILLSDEDEDEDIIIEKIPQRNTKGFCEPCKWWKESPIRRWKLVLFLVFGILTTLWLAIRFIDTLTGDILAAINALILACCGGRYFSVMLGLEKTVQKRLSKLRELNANYEPKKIEPIIQLKKDNIINWGKSKSLINNTNKYHQFNNKLSELTVDDQISQDFIDKLKKMSNDINTEIVKILLRHERDIISIALKKMKFGDDFTKNEYNAFLEKLPASYAERWKKSALDFERYAGDDGRVDVDEFMQVCDLFAQNQASSKMK